MLALAFRAGTHRFALPARSIVEVLPRTELHPVALAPPAVIGILPFRGALVPVVDLGRLVLGRDCLPFRSSRIIVIATTTATATRWFGLLAEDVLDLIDAGDSAPAIRLPEQPWLGEHLLDHPDLPQLLDPQALLPEQLATLFVAEAPA